jgi:hypothetical protein
MKARLESGHRAVHSFMMLPLRPRGPTNTHRRIDRTLAALRCFDLNG